MKLNKLKNQTFHRIGDEYAPYIDPGHFFGRNAFDELRTSKPRMNLKEYEHSGKLEIALPGFLKEEINLILENNALLISAKKAGYEHNVDDNYLRREYNPNFQIRYFLLSDDVDQDKITSRFENGILYVDLPKFENEHFRNGRRLVKVA